MHKETESLLRGSPVEARAEEWRRMEPPGENEPLPDARVTVDDFELRSLLAISLRPSAFPGDRARLLAVAEEEHAEERILQWLGSLPATQTFPNVESVWEALGGTPEQRERVAVEQRVLEPSPPEDIVVQQQVEPALRTAHVPAPEPPRAPLALQPAPSVVGRVCGLALAGVELAVGLMIEAVQQVRRRL
jgi:hypothetical protein